MKKGIKALAVASTIGIVLALAAASYGSNQSSQSTHRTAGAASASADPAWLALAKNNALKSQTIPTKIPSAAYGAFKPKSTATIYHIACNLALPGCTKIKNGIQAGVKALGYKFKLCNGGTTADQTTACFTNAINAKPDAIIINGIGTAGAADQFARVAKAGIPMIGTFTGNPPGVKGVATEIAGATCVKQSQQIADTVIADSNGTANVLFVGAKDFACLIQRQAGFIAAMAKCTTCKVSTLEFSVAGLTTQLPSQLQSALQSNPDLTYVVGTFDFAALQATDAIRQAGKSDKIKVLGYDGDAPNLALIQKGDIQIADNTTGAGEDGWAAADAAARAILKKKLNKITPVSTLVVTQKNFNAIPGGSGNYDGPTGYKAQFKKLWGKK